MQTDYPTLAKTIAALTDGETDAIALMATVACEVHHSDDRFDWTGFYRVTAPELLKIGPYQGGHGCLVIPFSRGVCGAAARTGRAQLVADVEDFPGHIACATSTRSELVLPVWNGAGDLIAVFDIDSDRSAAFTEEDADSLAAILASVFSRSGLQCPPRDGSMTSKQAPVHLWHFFGAAARRSDMQNTEAGRSSRSASKGKMAARTKGTGFHHLGYMATNAPHSCLDAPVRTIFWPKSCGIDIL